MQDLLKNAEGGVATPSEYTLN